MSLLLLFRPNAPSGASLPDVIVATTRMVGARGASASVRGHAAAGANPALGVDQVAQGATSLNPLRTTRQG